MNDYDYELKKSMDINIIRLNNQLKDHENIKRIYMVQYSPLSRDIKLLPKEIQKKIYIYALQFFWKNDILFNSKVPIYSIYINHLIKAKKDMYLNNIHFLHLDFNILPENKTYILGCQCDYCYRFNRKKKNELYNYVRDHKSRFFELINCDGSTFGNGVSSPNDYDTYEYISYVNGYNFTKGRYYSPLDEDPKDSPIYFTSDIQIKI